jgi:hypothetical protein
MMHPHHQQHHHHHHQHQQLQQQQQQVLYVQQQQQQANLLFYQYSQLRPMQATYSNPTLPSVTYEPKHQAQQAYRTDQLVPSSSPLIVTSPVQQKSQLQNHIQRSSPINMLPISLPHRWSNVPSTVNPKAFQPIIRTVSNSTLNIFPYTNANIGTNHTITPQSLSIPFESSNSIRHHNHSTQLSLLDSERRQRLHSGSSCYESNSSDHSVDGVEEENKVGRSLSVRIVRVFLLRIIFHCLEP